MGTKKILFMAAFLLFLAVIVSACAGPAGPVGPAGPAGPVGPAGPAGADGKSPAATDLTCTQCHNGTDLLSSKTEEWQTSQHGIGELFIGEGYNPSCAGCHSGGGFADMIAANLTRQGHQW